MTNCIRNRNQDGEKQFVILPYERVCTIQEALADIDDLNSLNVKGEEHNASDRPAGRSH